LRFEILVDAEEFWTRLSGDMAKARECVYLQTMSYEGDATGQMVGQALIDSPAADKRLIADDFYVRGKVSDKWLRSPRNLFNREVRRERAATLQLFDRMRGAGIGVVLRNPQGIIHQNFFARNHKKIYIADNACYIGGINVSDHNFAWHDMMIRIDDAQVAEFLKDDFRASFEGRDLSSSAEFNDIVLYRFDGRTNRRTFQPIFDLITGAKKSVIVISPYITFPFYEKLRTAQANGAEVTVLTPEDNNWKSFQTYTEWEAIRASMNLLMYMAGMSHLKAILIDDRYLVVGSSNFDKMSVVFMQEILAVITDREAIEAFKTKVLEPDLKRSEPKAECISSVVAWFNIIKFRLLVWLFEGYRALTHLGR